MPLPPQSSAARSVKPVDLSVGTIRVVMEEHEPLGLRLPREADGMRHARVPPPDAVWVLVLGELAVVEENVDVVGERMAGDPVGIERRELDAQDRLVVGDERE